MSLEGGYLVKRSHLFSAGGYVHAEFVLQNVNAVRSALCFLADNGLFSAIRVGIEGVAPKNRRLPLGRMLLPFVLSRFEVLSK